MNVPSYANEVHPTGIRVIDTTSPECQIEGTLHKLAADATRQRRLTDQLDSMSVPGYESLAGVLREAYAQAAAGKGRERHANNLPFNEQTIMESTRAHGVGFAAGQAEKKARESRRMDTDPAVRELLGAIVYLAAAVLGRRAGY